MEDFIVALQLQFNITAVLKCVEYCIFILYKFHFSQFSNYVSLLLVFPEYFTLMLTASCMPVMLSCMSINPTAQWHTCCYLATTPFVMSLDPSCAISTQSLDSSATTVCRHRLPPPTPVSGLDGGFILLQKNLPMDSKHFSDHFFCNNIPTSLICLL